MCRWTDPRTLKDGWFQKLIEGGCVARFGKDSDYSTRPQGELLLVLHHTRSVNLTLTMEASTLDSGVERMTSNPSVVRFNHLRYSERFLGYARMSK